MKNLSILATGAGGAYGRSMIYYLNKFDFDIVAVDCNKDLLCASKTKKRYIVPPVYQKDYFEVINKIIKKNKIDLVLFQSDQEIKEASKNINKIKAKVWLPDFETVKNMQDKYYCNQVWIKKGVSAPKSEIIFSNNQLKGNVWLRPLNSVGGGGKLAIHARTKRDAKKWIDQNKGWGEFTMNEYLPGRIFGFDSLWKSGKIMNYSLKERLMYNKEGIGYSTSIVKTSRNKKAIKTAIDAILAVCSLPDGIFSVDMRENKRGVPCVTEINPGRFLTTSLLLFRELNYDLPLDYLNLMLGKKVQKRGMIAKNKYLFFIKGLTRVLDEKDMKIEHL